MVFQISEALGQDWLPQACMKNSVHRVYNSGTINEYTSIWEEHFDTHPWTLPNSPGVTYSRFNTPPPSAAVVLTSYWREDSAGIYWIPPNSNHEILYFDLSTPIGGLTDTLQGYYLIHPGKLKYIARIVNKDSILSYSNNYLPRISYSIESYSVCNGNGSNCSPWYASQTADTIHLVGRTGTNRNGFPIGYEGWGKTGFINDTISVFNVADSVYTDERCYGDTLVSASGLAFWCAEWSCNPQMNTPQILNNNYPHLYPNPCEDFITSSHFLDWFEILDLSGKTVLKGKGNKIDLSDLKAGIYLFRSVSGINKIVKL